MRAGAIGDFILTLPALRALRQAFPGCRLALAARADVLPLVEGWLAEPVIAFDSPLLTPLFVPDSDVPAPLAMLLGEIELAVLWLSEHTAQVVAGNLRRFGARRLIAANPLPAARHASDHLLDTLAPLGISIPPLPSPVLSLTPALRARADAFWQTHRLSEQTRVVALHVGSGGERKRWPLDHIIALARKWVSGAGTRALLITGPAERALTGALGDLPPGVVPLRSPDLATLAAIIARCHLYIGSDSGITHLAAALGVPTVALFGPTDPLVWGPRGARVSIVQSPTARMADLTIEAVWSAAQRLLESAPALRREPDDEGQVMA
ncbi:MAG: glycosyltransferase family 9 protein [Chloroflexi bacterium]|nr:glycosyltransferase family 9 protein [Chloroflexota bacterium]